MTELWHIILIFFAGISAGLINISAGGGSTISLPVLILIGIDPITANGTNRVAIILESLSALITFKKEKIFHFQKSLKLALVVLPGAVLGGITAIYINPDSFKIILGFVMLFIVSLNLIPHKKHAVLVSYGDEKFPIILYPILFVVGFYGGFIQAGVGLLIIASLSYFLHTSLLHSNVHKAFIVLVYNIAAIVIFSASGNVDILAGLTLGIGNAIGAWISVKLSVKKGEVWIKRIILIAILLIAVRFIGIF